MTRASPPLTTATIMISLLLFTPLLALSNSFEVLSHYETLTGDCETVLHCRATLTIGRYNGDIVVAAGYVIRNTLPAVPPSEYVAIGVVPVVKNWTHYTVNSAQLTVTYHADISAPVQCVINTNSMAMAIYHSMFFATQSCSDIGQPACEQFRLLGRCVALPSATPSTSPSASASLLPTPVSPPVLDSASASISALASAAVLPTPDASANVIFAANINPTQAPTLNLTVSPTLSTAKPSENSSTGPVISASPTLTALFSIAPLVSVTASASKINSVSASFSATEPGPVSASEPVLPSISTPASPSAFLHTSQVPRTLPPLSVLPSLSAADDPLTVISPSSTPLLLNALLSESISTGPTTRASSSSSPSQSESTSVSASVRTTVSPSMSPSATLSVSATVLQRASPLAATLPPLKPAPSFSPTPPSQSSSPSISALPSTSATRTPSPTPTLSPSLSASASASGISIPVSGIPLLTSTPFPSSSLLSASASASASITTTISPLLSSSVSTSARATLSPASLPLLSPIPSVSLAPPPSSSSPSSAPPSISATTSLDPSPSLSPSLSPAASSTPSPVSVLNLSPVQSVANVPLVSDPPTSASPSILPNSSSQITAIGDTVNASLLNTTASPMNRTHSKNVSIGLHKLFAINGFYVLRDLVSMANMSIAFPSNTIPTLLAPTDAAFIRTARYLLASPDIRTADHSMTSSAELNRSTIHNILANGVRFRNESLTAAHFARMILNYHIVIDPVPVVGIGALLHTRLGVPVILTTLDEAVDQSPATPNGVIDRNVVPPVGNFHIHGIDAVMVPDVIAVNMTQIHSCQV